MQRKLLVVTAILCFVYSLCALSDNDKIATISSELVKLIDLDEPIFLDIRAGEWTSQMENEIRTQLLGKDADIREQLPELHSPASDSESVDIDQTKAILDNFQTDAAYLYQISLDIEWNVLEHKKLFAYRVERVPTYSFTIKKILLPENRLLALNIYKYSGNAPETLSSREIRLKWFDPIIASLAIGSLIYLLWTIE